MGENIPASSPSPDLPTTSNSKSQDEIPTEIWSNIISFLPIGDRCRVEGVNHQLSEAAKATWARLQLKSLLIAEPMVDSATKLATLLRRCGSHLEEIVVERHIRLDTEAPLFHMCPNVKILSFTRGRGLLAVARGSVQSSFAFHQEAAVTVQRFLEFMPSLERLQLFHSMDHDHQVSYPRGRYQMATLREMVPGMVSLANLLELHLPFTGCDGHGVRHLGALQHLRVLSVTVQDHLGHIESSPTHVFTMSILSPLDEIFSSIGQLHRLEQLHVAFRAPVESFFSATVVRQLSDSLPNLRSLALRFSGDPGENATVFPVGCLDALLAQFTQLHTLVIVTHNQQCLEGDVDGPVPVDLSRHRHRLVPLNVFVVDCSLPSFTGHSPQIQIIPLPNGRYGEAVEFLSTYNQYGFDYGAEKCLQMVKMSKDVDGEWDFSYAV